MSKPKAMGVTSDERPRNPFTPQGSGVESDMDYMRVTSDAEMHEARSRNWEPCAADVDIYNNVSVTRGQPRWVKRPKAVSARVHEERVREAIARQKEAGLGANEFSVEVGLKSSTQQMYLPAEKGG